MGVLAGMGGVETVRQHALKQRFSREVGDFVVFAIQRGAERCDVAVGAGRHSGVLSLAGVIRHGEPLDRRHATVQNAVAAALASSISLARVAACSSGDVSIGSTTSERTSSKPIKPNRKSRYRFWKSTSKKSEGGV